MVLYADLFSEIFIQLILHILTRNIIFFYDYSNWRELSFNMFKFFMVDSSPDRVKPKTIKLVVVAYPLDTQHQGEKIGWLGIMIMCLSGDTFLPIDSCFTKSNEYVLV
jgi:hypothetical protein